MLRSQSLRFAYAMTMVLTGFAICVLGPIITMAVSRPEFSPTADLNTNMLRYTNDIYQAGALISWNLGVGICVSGMGALLAFVEWVRRLVSTCK